ncbi:MAG TPA: PLP-dependent aminotransferase family protein [bacterium]|nr:PLP-dependent aminotransferase family protein [bacterium]
MVEKTKQVLYQKIAGDLKKRIISGEFDKDKKLSSIREIASRYSTTPVTVTNALKLLENDGLIERKGGSGVFLKERSRDPFFPVDDLKKIFNSILENEGSDAFEYGESSGFHGLKDVLRPRLQGVLENMEKREILITSGSQQALHLIFSSLLKVGDWVLVEEPTYLAALRILREKGVRIETVSMKENGPDMKELKRIFESRPLKMAYLMPRYQSPTGLCYSNTVKSAVAGLANKNGVYIVEDNSFGELDFGGNTEEPLKVSSSLHIYLSSFSKTFLSGARVGYCICGKDIYRNLTMAKEDSDLASPLFFQIVLSKYIKSGQYDKRLKKINNISRNIFKEIKEKVKETVQKYGGEMMNTKGGYSFWCRIKDSESAKFITEMKKEGFKVENGKEFTIHEIPDCYCVKYVRGMKKTT